VSATTTLLGLQRFRRPRKTAKVTGVAVTKATKSGMSEEGRAKIAAAQQKRWAKIRRAKKKAAKAALAVPAAE
jgi:hypothetical protein